MGTWGTGIFSGDVECDVRADFRELIAAGRSPQEAMEQLLVSYEMAEPAEPDDCPAWLALAVTQWKTGRVVDQVRDTALRAIELELAQPRFDGADRRKRAVALAKARDLLNRTPPAPRRIRAERFAQSPFAPGDVLRYTTACGRQVALWAMFNKRHEGVAHVSVNTAFRLQAIGDPALPPVAQIVEQPPLVMTNDNGYRNIRQFFLDQPQDATGPAWELIGNVPFPEPHAVRHGPFGWVPAIRTRRAPTFDDTLESCFEHSRVVDPAAGAVQPFIDLMPAAPAHQGAWTGSATAKAENITSELAVELHERSEARCAQALAVVERYLAGDDPARRRIAITVLDGLVNAATHPAVAFDRDDLLRRLSPVARAMVARLDDAWEAVEPSAVRPPELLPEAEARERILVWSIDSQWLARLRNRDLGDGTYRVCWSGAEAVYPEDGRAPYARPHVARPSPAITID